MKLYLFERIERVSSNYHSEGGLAIIAESMEQAHELIGKYNDEKIREWSGDIEIDVTEEEWGEVVTYELAGDVEPHVYTFPDAGCC